MPLRNYLANTKRSANGNNFGFVPFLRLVAFVTKDMLSMHCLFHFRVFTLHHLPYSFLSSLLCLLPSLSHSLKELKCGFNIHSSPKLCRTLSKTHLFKFSKRNILRSKMPSRKHIQRAACTTFNHFVC